MKLFFSIIILSFSYSLLLSQGTWTQKADFGGGVRVEAVGFSILNKGYIATGTDSIYRKDFWEYDPATNIWTQKSNFAGTARHNAVAFSIGAKGYVGTGEDSLGYKKDFWEYNPILNSWIQKIDFGGSARTKAVGFSIGGKGYIGTGNDNDSLRSDFWEYDTTLNVWSQKANFGGTARSKAVGFSISGKGYIGTGIDSADFWEYDPFLDTWIRKTDILTTGGTGRYSAVGFSMNNRGYIGTGNIILAGPLDDFWEYSPMTDTWKQKSNYKNSTISGNFGMGFGTWNAVGFSIGNKGFIGTGESTWFPSNYGIKKDFWEFDTTSVGINEPKDPIAVSVFPNPFSAETKISFQSSIFKKQNFELTIYDINGKKVKSTIIRNADSIIIHRDNLQAGIYFFVIGNNQKTVTTGKFIVID